MVFDFCLYDVSETKLTDLHVLNHPCELGMNPSRSWCMIFLICCWIWCTNILLRIFESVLIRDIGLVFFFGSVFIWLWYQHDGGFIECLWECSLLLSLLEE